MKEIDWKEPELKKWTDGTRSESTKSSYRDGYKKYFLFTGGLSASQLIDEAEADANTPARMRKDAVVNRLLAFYKWLKTDIDVHSWGDKTQIIRKGLADTSTLTCVTAVRSFYASNGFTVRMKGKSSLPKPKIVNRRMKLNSEQVKTLVDNARSLRDKAVVLTMFQSGVDASTLCGLTYGNISSYIQTNDPSPWKLDLYRSKTGVDYSTFLHDDAINAIKAYLKDAEFRGVKFNNQTRLFLQVRQMKPMSSDLIASILKDVASRSGLIHKLAKEEVNPISPHALRESFSSLMLNSGVAETIVDFWLGHEIETMAQAYKALQSNKVRDVR